MVGLNRYFLLPLGLPTPLLSFLQICPVITSKADCICFVAIPSTLAPYFLIRPCPIWLYHISHNSQPFFSSRLLLSVVLLTFPSRFPAVDSFQSSQWGLRALPWPVLQSFFLRTVPTCRHSTDSKVYRAMTTEAPRPRYTCGSRKEAAEGFTKAAAPLGFLLAGEALSCTAATGAPIPCLCPVKAPEPQSQETWV